LSACPDHSGRPADRALSACPAPGSRPADRAPSACPAPGSRPADRALSACPARHSRPTDRALSACPAPGSRPADRALSACPARAAKPAVTADAAEASVLDRWRRRRSIPVPVRIVEPRACVHDTSASSAATRGACCGRLAFRDIRWNQISTSNAGKCRQQRQP
jgi:hypothetical protein